MLDIRSTDPISGASPELVSSIRDHRTRLASVRIFVRAGRMGYQAGPGMINIIEPDEKSGEPQDPPEEIAEAVFELAARFAESHGSNWFRADLHDDDGEKLAEQKFPVTLSGRGEPANDDASGELLSQARQMVINEHKMRRETTQELIALVKEIRHLAQPLGDFQVKIAELEQRERHEAREHEARMNMQSEGFDFLKELAGPLGQTISESVNEARRRRNPSDGDRLCKKWQALLEKMGPEKRGDIEAILGDDLTKLAAAMEHAATDGEFKNIAREFGARVSEMPDASAFQRKIGMTLGPTLATELGSILNEATA